MAINPNSTGFFFDVKAWRGSRAVQRMTMAERGVFFEMLCEQWEKRDMPDNAQEVAEAISCTDAQVAEVLAAWPVVRRKFLAARGDDTRIYNETLERTRQKQKENRRKRIDAGALADALDAIQHADGLVGRSGGHLGGPGLARFLVDQQQVRERAADVYTQTI